MANGAQVGNVTDWHTASSVWTGGTGIEWIADGASLTSDCQTSDDSRAVASFTVMGNTKFLNADDFDPAIPVRVAGGSPTYIELEIERSATVVSLISDLIIKLRINGSAAGDDLSVGGFWPTTDASQSYGSFTSDLWNAGPTVADVRLANSGVRIRASNVAGFVDARIDLVRARYGYIDRLDDLVQPTKGLLRGVLRGVVT